MITNQKIYIMLHVYQIILTRYNCTALPRIIETINYIVIAINNIMIMSINKQYHNNTILCSQSNQEHFIYGRILQVVRQSVKQYNIFILHDHLLNTCNLTGESEGTSTGCVEL